MIKIRDVICKNNVICIYHRLPVPPPDRRTDYALEYICNRDNNYIDKSELSMFIQDIDTIDGIGSADL